MYYISLSLKYLLILTQNICIKFSGLLSLRIGSFRTKNIENKKSISGLKKCYKNSAVYNIYQIFILLYNFFIIKFAKLIFFDSVFRKKLYFFIRCT